jgi:Stress responsive A/B Barrel Domain
MPIQHVLLMKFSEPLDQISESELREHVRSWPRLIGEMTALRIGPSFTPERTRGYQYLMYMEFPDEASLRRYQDHPAHKAFVAWASALGSDPLAFDYYLDDATVIPCG